MVGMLWMPLNGPAPCCVSHVSCEIWDRHLLRFGRQSCLQRGMPGTPTVRLQQKERPKHSEEFLAQQGCGSGGLAHQPAYQRWNSRWCSLCLAQRSGNVGLHRRTKFHPPSSCTAHSHRRHRCSPSLEMHPRNRPWSKRKQAPYFRDFVRLEENGCHKKWSMHPKKHTHPDPNMLKEFQR